MPSEVEERLECRSRGAQTTPVPDDDDDRRERERARRRARASARGDRRSAIPRARRVVAPREDQPEPARDAATARARSRAGSGPSAIASEPERERAPESAAKSWMPRNDGWRCPARRPSNSSRARGTGATPTNVAAALQATSGDEQRRSASSSVRDSERRREREQRVLGELRGRDARARRTGSRRCSDGPERRAEQHDREEARRTRSRRPARRGAARSPSAQAGDEPPRPATASTATSESVDASRTLDQRRPSWYCVRRKSGQVGVQETPRAASAGAPNERARSRAARGARELRRQHT